MGRRWFQHFCPSCGLSSALERMDDETVSFGCPGCRCEIISGPPPPDPLAAARHTLERIAAAPSASPNDQIGEIALLLAEAFDGVVVTDEHRYPAGP